MPKQSELEYFLQLNETCVLDDCFQGKNLIQTNKYEHLSNTIIKKSLDSDLPLISTAYQYLSYNKIEDVKSVLRFSETMGILISYPLAIEHYQDFKRDRYQDFAYNLFQFIINQKIEHKGKIYSSTEFIKTQFEELINSSYNKSKNTTAEIIKNAEEYKEKIHSLEMIEEYENFTQEERICLLPYQNRDQFIKKFSKSLKIYQDNLLKPYLKKPKFQNHEMYIKKIKKELQKY